MQVYINETAPKTTLLKTVQPNKGKVFVKNLIYVSGTAAGIILLLMYLDNVVGLEVFMIPLKLLGVNIDANSILFTAIAIFLGIAIIFLAFSYFSIAGVRYEFYEDRLRIYQPTLLFFSTLKEVSYKNVVKISYDFNGFMNKLLSAGDVTIDVTGMKEGFVKMELIDETEELVEKLLKIVKDYNSLQQMQFEENRKIDNIMKRF
ncbi:MAG: hypothetical protein ACP5OA_02025 [Candidatus Woesearchaeota archaeon]